MPDTITVGQLLARARKALADAGIEGPSREARLLLALVLGCDPSTIIAKESHPISPDEAAAFEGLVLRRAKHEPFAHLSLSKHFYGLEFKSDARALIPRPDSEVVVETALDLLALDKPLQIADIGTGSGCLLVSILKNRPLSSGVGVDLSVEAIELCAENIEKHNLQSRARCEHLDWREWQGWGDVDLIISNPPYISSSDMDDLDPNVREYEPHLALDGGVDGLTAYRSIVDLASKYMQPGAALVFEIGFDQKDAVQSLLEVAQFDDIQSEQDLTGHDRVIRGVKRA